MKKKLSGAEKYEKQLRFHFKELKRAGLIGKSLPLKEFRKSNLARRDLKEVVLIDKDNKPFKRRFVKFVPVKQIIEHKIPVKRVKISREAQKATRRAMKHFVLTQKQKDKAERKLKKEEANNLARKQRAALRRAA